MKQEATATATTAPRTVGVREGYRLWARTYDEERSPFLSLEERYLQRLLPPVTGTDVLDLGCGTGRWLKHFAAQAPRKLVGIDASPEMLAYAKQKLGGAAEIREGDCIGFSTAQASADLVLCSFLLSYIEGLETFAQRLRQILRPGGSLFLTDIHPETIRRLHWRRGFKIDGQPIEVRTYPRSLPEIVQTLGEAGFAMEASLQPSFGDPEFARFEKANKVAEWHRAAALPAIYILQLGIPDAKAVVSDDRASAATLCSVGSARIALGALESFHGSITFESCRVAHMAEASAGSARRDGLGVDLTDFFLLPGLINAHDHLEFSLFPRLGRGGYRNYTEWAADIHSSDAALVEQHRAVPRETRLRWGGIRNLLCGVTTVCHHNPYDQSVFEADFPVRVLKQFGWAHSLAFECDVAGKKALTPPDQPFILHVSEGIDAESKEELVRFHREIGLDSQTVLVHGLGADAAGGELIRSHGASLIWCPSSNVFLFGRTQTTAEIGKYPSVALGNDSPLTADGDLLDEIRFAHDRLNASAEDLFEMVMTRAAAALKLRQGEGTLRIGARADFIAVRDRGLSPAATLSELAFEDVELVAIGGRVELASPKMMQRLPTELTDGLQPLRIAGELRWIRQNVRRLCAGAPPHLTEPIRLNGRRVAYERVD